MNKKGQVSRTVILFSMILFYVCLFVFLQFFGSYVVKYQIDGYTNPYTSSGLKPGEQCPGSSSVPSGVPEPGSTIYGVPCMSIPDSMSTINVTTYGGLNSFHLYFIDGLVFINKEAWWLNVILFAPLFAFTIYLLIVAFIPTINPGA
jgi:hypothetical protein